MRSLHPRLGTLWTGAAAALASCCLLGCSDSAEPGTRTRAEAPAGSTTEAAKTEPQDPVSTPEEDAAALIARGRRVFTVNCTACHNADVTQDGGLGPAVAGASRELLEARILRAEYPAGYVPKRDSRAMIALPHLANDIDALAAYINQSRADES